MKRKPIRPTRMAAIVAGGVAAAFMAMLSLWLLVNVGWSNGNTGTIKAEAGDWEVQGRITGSGAADGEAFSTASVETLAFRDGVRVDRVYKGRRIAIRTSAGIIHGTITRLDVLEKRLVLADCVAE